MAAPLLQQTLPSDNATGISVTSNIGLGFDQAVKAGSGYIRIYKSDGTLFHTIAITDTSQVTFSTTQPAKVLINPNVDLVAGTGYYILVDSGAIENVGGEDYAGISSSTTLNFTTAGTAPSDTTAPLLNTTTPADNATGVAVGSNLVLTFNEAVKAGSGSIEIRKVSDGTIAKTIAITDATQVTFSGSQLTINPSTDLAAGTDYYVTFGSGVVRDLANNNFAGLAAAAMFNFTTSGTLDTTQPLLVSSSPADGATNVDAQANLVITFDEAVKAGSGNIWVVSGGITQIIDVTDTSQISFSGSQMTINPSLDLVEGAGSYIIFGLGVVRDLVNNSFYGLVSPEDLNFTIADPTAPTLLNAQTSSGSVYVGDYPYFVFTFSESIQRGSGNVEFRNALDGSLVRTIAITDEDQVYVSSSLIQVTPDSPLPQGINYYVTIGSGVILDGAGNSFAGISSPTAFNFSTYPLDLIGTQANDTLTGGTRNEVLNGLTGVDTLIGGLGDDTYIIDNYEGGATSFVFYAPPEWFGDFHQVASYLPNADDLTFELADVSLDGLVDLLAIGFQDDDNWAILVVSTNEIGQNLTEGATYTDARPAWTAGHAGLNLNASGAWSSNSNYASFTVTNLDIDYSDPDNPVLLSLSISFESRNYYPDWPVMYGTVNYNYPAAGPVTLDTIVEGPNAGIDTVRAAMSYTLPDNFENLTLTDWGTDINGTGNGANNIIIGNSSNNILDGKAGVDTMTGSYGNDIYYVDNPGDQAIEDQDSYGGQDMVFSSATFTLGIYIESLELTGSANVNGTGNAYGNGITGNSGANVLNGGLGNDSLHGAGGNDTFVIVAGAGSDVIGDFAAGAGIGDLVVLDGFALGTFSAVQAAMSQNGSDTILNLGNGETLYFNNVAKAAFSANDFTFLNVQGSPGPLPFTLPVSGAFTNTISGTRRADNLTGTSANNRLDGKQGNDTMTGLAGDDTYVVDSSGDTVVESSDQGIDTVISSASSYVLANNVENLSLTGTSNHTATGNDLNNLIIASNRPDIINGGAGNDIIRAGTGACVLTGGTGNDMFDFDVMGSLKTITDFQVGEDLADLRTLLAWYGGSNPVGDGVIAVTATAGGVLVSVNATAGGSLQSLVKLTGISVGDLDVGSDILWE